jgi:signal transduction histidine kinase
MPSSRLELRADRLRVEQALSNLVENALRHGDGEVLLTAVPVDGLVELHVRDEGLGFPPQFLDQAFERFARADGARTGGTSGLGLSIVRVIAEAHGGSAHVANTDGGGADAWIALPLPA